ncbi:MAG: hypothetical protein R3E53_12785 [Myxococcota bacterium]
MHMIPFYIFYSMFQRIGDLAWAAGDMQCRGLPARRDGRAHDAGGRGLQHQDGHSHVLANFPSSCITYDPAYAYELAVMQDGLRRMYRDGEDVYLLRCRHERNCTPQPDMPEGCRRASCAGCTGCGRGAARRGPRATTRGLRVQLLGSGTILREVLAAAECSRRTASPPTSGRDELQRARRDDPGLDPLEHHCIRRRNVG